MSSTLLESWTQTVAAARAAPALIDANSARVWSRDEIDREAYAWHVEHGAATGGQTIAFTEANGPDWLRIFIGLMKSGATAVPLDPGEPPLAQRAAATAVGASLLWRNGRLEAIGRRGRARRDGRRLVKLTSGSTGTPRALVFTDAELLADGRQICAGMGIARDDINLGIIPWGHSYGFGNLVLPLITQGTAIVFGVAPLPHGISSAVAKLKPTIFPAVPALLRALVESDVRADELVSLRLVISAGAPLTADVAHAFHARFGRKIHSFYGSSETGGITYDPTGDSAAAARGVGRPLPGVRLKFGGGGYFTVTSDAVFTIGNRRNGAHRMADIGKLDTGGELVLLGRAGRFVKIAGRRLNLAEVEHAIRQLPGVRDALVAPHAQRADALAAAVATDRPATELKDALRERLASWKIPRKWVILGEFPITPRGKPDTRKLRDLLGAEEGAPGAPT